MNAILHFSKPAHIELDHFLRFTGKAETAMSATGRALVQLAVARLFLEFTLVL